MNFYYVILYKNPNDGLDSVSEWSRHISEDTAIKVYRGLKKRNDYEFALVRISKILNLNAMKKLNSQMIEEISANSELINLFYISMHYRLPLWFIREYKDYLNWYYITDSYIISESVIREFKFYVNWSIISRKYALSEAFIREFKDFVDWRFISAYQNLSESFIREFKDYINWRMIIRYKPLSEDFMREFKDCINFESLYINQKISEIFIEEFKDDVLWDKVVMYQPLSEPFIEKYINYINLDLLVRYKRLSEEFLERHINDINWGLVSKYQKLSKEFKEKYKDYLIDEYIKDNWHYKSIKFKKDAIVKSNLYECHKDYFIAYKAIRNNRYSLFNFQLKYLKGETYESWADTSDNPYSFGLSAWTKKGAIKYGMNVYSYKIVRVKVYYKDVARLTEQGKIRAFRLTILD